MVKRKKESVLTVDLKEFERQGDEDLAEQYAGEYHFHRWNWGFQCDAVNHAMKVNIGTGLKQLHTGDFNFWMVALSLVKTPFGHTRNGHKVEDLRNIPNWLGMKLTIESEKVNGIQGLSKKG